MSHPCTLSKGCLIKLSHPCRSPAYVQIVWENVEIKMEISTQCYGPRLTTLHGFENRSELVVGVVSLAVSLFVLALLLSGGGDPRGR